MSHFSLLVIHHPEQDLEDVLAPFHEFECTGIDDQYVQEIDITEKARAEYEKHTSTRLRDMEGKLHDPYDDMFYRDPTPEEKEKHTLSGTGVGGDISWTSKDWGDGLGYRAKVRFIPTGWEEVTVMIRDEKTFAEFVEYWEGKPTLIDGQPRGEEHKYGFCHVDRDGNVIRVVDRTNPNRKWDWWVLGGRWSGAFAGANKIPPHEDPRNFEMCFICRGTGMRNDTLGLQARERDPSYTCNGCKGKGQSLKHAPQWVQEDNQIRAGDLHLDELKRKAVQERQKQIDSICEKSGLSVPALQKALEIEREAHEAWLQLPEPRPRGADYGEYVIREHAGDNAELIHALKKARLWDNPSVEKGQTIEQWIQAAPPLSFYAVLKSGEWYEKGTMGWWGISINEKDQSEWLAQIEKLVRDLDPDMMLSCVDCHI